MLQGKQMLRNTDSNHLTLPLRGGGGKETEIHTVLCVTVLLGK